MMPGQYTAPYRSLRLETLILLIFTIILSSGSFARAEGVEETIKKVLVNNPQITGAEADFNAARDDLGVARAGYLPSVDLDIRYGRENTDIRQLSANGGGTQNLWRREAGITVSEMLWDGNSTSGEVARRGALLNSAEHSLADTQNALAFQTVQAYFDVMRNRELVELSSTILQSHEKILSSVRDKQDSGAGNKVDVEQVLARIALTQSTLLARQGSLRESIARFQRIVGDAPGPLVRPAIKFSGLTENGVVNSVKLNPISPCSLFFTLSLAIM